MPRLETSDFSSTSLWTEQLQGAETLSSQLRGSGRAPGDTWQSRQLLRTGNKGRPSHTEADAPERCQAPAPPPPPGLPNCHLLRSPPLTCCPAQIGVLRKTLPVARIPPLPAFRRPWFPLAPSLSGQTSTQPTSLCLCHSPSQRILFSQPTSIASS